MPGLDDIAVFVKVVQAGSFTQAARLLKMPNTTVSAKVAALERRLGTTLIQRTTRKLHVTAAGEAYFRRCAQALEEIHSAETEATTAQAAPQGLLRITSAVDVGQTLLPGMVRAYLKKYPQMKVDLLVTNRVVDLIAEGVDLAIRAGELEDSTFLARKIVSTSMTLWASPSYLKKSGKPAHPRELAKHELIRFSSADFHRADITNGKERIRLAPESKLSVDDLGTIKTFVLQGLGIALMPHFLCEEEAKRGDLVAVLPQWRWGAGHFSLVHPAQRFVSPKVSAFIQIATEICRAEEG